MLRSAATEESRDWDKLIPYLLFAYREMPQASTGFSPFEFLYDRAVRRPLDILKEMWEAISRSNESVVSYVLAIQERLARVSELAGETSVELSNSRSGDMIRMPGSKCLWQVTMFLSCSLQSRTSC